MNFDKWHSLALGMTLSGFAIVVGILVGIFLKWCM